MRANIAGLEVDPRSDRKVTNTEYHPFQLFMNWLLFSLGYIDFALRMGQDIKLSCVQDIHLTEPDTRHC